MTSFILHIMAMTFMLSDHIWATMLPAQEWMTCVGRLAFPIFAFMIVEGYFHTSNIKKYMGRILIFAIISEIPFDLIYGSTIFYPFHQNVLWTFLIALVSIVLCEKAEALNKWWLSWPIRFVIVAAAYLVGTITMVDFYGSGVLMVLVFYFFHQKTWWAYLGQFLCLAYINISMLGGLFYPVTIGGMNFEIVQQGFALFALIPIWLYNGKQGYHSKWFQYLCYAFYPAHLLVLYLIWQAA